MSKYLDEYVLGEHFVSAARTVTECDVVNFACMTGDMHPNHTDAEVMKHSQFGQRIAHGLLGISWAHGFLDRLDLITDSAIAFLEIQGAYFLRRHDSRGNYGEGRDSQPQQAGSRSAQAVL